MIERDARRALSAALAFDGPADMDDPASLVEHYAAAVLAKDVDAFIALYDPAVRIFDLWGTWSHDGIDAWRGMVAGWFRSLGPDRVVVDFDDVRTTLADDLAVVTAFIGYRNVALDGTSPHGMHNRVTWVLRRRDDGWRIVHEHTSAPVAMDTMKVMLTR